MVELGQLEAHWQDFAKRNVQIVVVSIEDEPTAKLTQADFPHLRVVSDAAENISKAIAVVHPSSAPDGRDTSAPTTILLDRQATVRWVYRPDRVFTRLSPTELLTAVDREMPADSKASD